MPRYVALSAFCTALCALPLHVFAAVGDVIEPSKSGDSVRISIGEQFTVAFDERGDRLVNPRRVEGAQERPVVTLKFSIEKKEHEIFRLLAINSSYPRILRYRAAARTSTTSEFRETNMFPLNPNIPVFEAWLDPFTELLLFDFHLTDEQPPK